MSTLREAAQQALETLEALSAAENIIWVQKRAEIEVEHLRAVLAQEEQDTNPHQHAVDDWRLHGGPGETRSAQTPCDIAEDGVCEVIDCCRKLPQILEALEIGYDSAQAEAAQYHVAMAGYRPERHAEMDANVAKIAAAITALRAALAQQVQEPELRELLIGAAAMAVAAERKGVYQGASWVADAVLAQQEQGPVRAESVTTPPCKGMNCGAIDGRSHSLECHAEHSAAIAGGRFVPLPRREWKGLSEEDMEDLLPLYSDPSANTEMLDFAAAIEVKLKEKNHG